MVKKFFCSNCMETYEVEVDYEIKVNTKDSKVKYDCFVNFMCPCDCGNVMYEIDDKMFDPIVRLNKLGFYTEYCCEGHWEDGRVSYPYIKFNSDDDAYRDDYMHKIKDSQSFLHFLEENLIKPICVEYDDTDNSITVRLNDKDMSKDEIERLFSDESFFEECKESFLLELDRIITLLEEQKGE